MSPSSDIANEADSAEREYQQNDSNNNVTDESTPLINNRQQQYPTSDNSRDYLLYYSDSPISIRLLKFLLYFLLILCVTWLILLTVNVFTSIKPFIVPGSGFLELDLTLLSLARLIIGLKFFASATISDLYLSYLSVLILFVDIIVLTSVPHFRHRHGGTVVGIITLIGSFLVFASCAGCVSLVLKLYYRARDEESSIVNNNSSSSSEEEREEEGEGEGTASRRSRDKKKSKKLILKNILTSSASFSGCLVTTALTILFTVFLFINTFHQSMDPPYPGKMVSVGNSRYNVHVACTEPKKSLPDNSKNLTLLLESDIDTPSPVFAGWVREIADNNDNVNRLCYWDRPGLGLSDSAPSPQSISTTLNTLTEALEIENVNFNSSFMLIAHGVGGLYSRSYAASKPEKVHGILLIDTPHEDLYLSKLTSWKGLLYFFKGLASPISLGGYYKAKLQQHLARGLIKREINTANTMLNPNIPLTVVSSAQSIAHSDRWGEGQRKLTKLSNNTIAWKVFDGPHNIWEDKDSKTQLQALLYNLLALG